MLEKVTHIEGLDVHEDHELFDDTDPTVVQTRFYVKSEEMPFLSEKEGRIVRKNLVYVRRTWDMGRSDYSRPINDLVEWDERTSKWVVKKLTPGMVSSGPISDIRRNPNEWNAFARGSGDQIVGVPLTLLFPNDPSLVEHYASKHIKSIEQLSALNETNLQDLGGFSREHVAKAKSYLDSVKENAEGVKVTAMIEQKDRQIAALEARLADMAEKFSELLDKVENPKKKSKKQVQESTLEEI